MFSYVVVGGGTAGLAVASRLAENPAFSILVIEAGVAGPDGQNDDLLNDPSQADSASIGYNWYYNVCLRKCLSMTKGEVLDGSSSINGRCWTRGTIDQNDSEILHGTSAKCCNT